MKPRHCIKDEKLAYFLRILFIHKKEDEIKKLLWNYFKAIEIIWPDAWNDSGSKSILNKATGFNGLMRYLKHCYLHLTTKQVERIPSTGEFLSIIDKVSLKSKDFTLTNFELGTNGSYQLFKRFMDDTKIA